MPDKSLNKSLASGDQANTSSLSPTASKAKRSTSKSATSKKAGATKASSEQNFNGLIVGDQPVTAATAVQGEDSPVITKASRVSAARVQQFLLGRFNPIRGLSPQVLANALDNYDLGYIRQMQLIWDKIRDRDDQLQAVCVKRELAPTDMEWEIVQTEESPEADAHKEALEEFYGNLSVTHAINQNTRGGVSLLIRQMMRAVGDKFSVHEIVWKPGDVLTAEFRYVTLWFFENRTGQLRFLPFENALTGVDLDPAGWVVHSGEGLFQASSIAYIYKQLALKTWVNYNEKFGMPFLHGKTNAEENSTEWQQFKDALASFSSDGSILTNTAGEIEAIAAGAGTGIPMEQLLERMDRAFGRIWNGGDLHTMSRGGGAGVGSNPQMKSQDDLAKADAEALNETLNFYVDRWVIQYKFGVAPKAKFQLLPKPDIDTTKEIEIDEFLISVGCKIAKNDLAERYGRSLADESADVAENPTPPVVPFPGSKGAAPGKTGLDNAVSGKYQVESIDIVARAQAKALAPVRERLAGIAKLGADKVVVALKKLKSDLPKLLGRTVTPELQDAIAETLGASVVAGAVDGAKETHNRLTLGSISHHS